MLITSLVSSLVAIAVITFAFFTEGYITWSSDPYAGADICVVSDTPGATDRYVTYTPVRCSDPAVELGEPYGTSYAELDWYDLDGDDQPEMIIESSAWRCSLGADCLDAKRFEIKVYPNDEPPHFELLRVVDLDHLNVDY